MSLMKHLKHFASALARGDFRLTDQGLVLAGAVRVRGTYRCYIDGDLVGVHHNLVPTQGLNYLLDVGLRNQTQLPNWYLAIFQGSGTPAANWTAANFDSVADEITSTTEGYPGSDRPAWVPAAASSGVITNAASLASYAITATTSVTITGAALLSDSTRGGGTGTLVSASRFGTSHTVNDGATFELGYEVELNDT